MTEKSQKSRLYEQVARIGRAVASPKRLELLELLAQGEKSVETLAAELGADIKLTSAHLKALRDARLVASHREGKFVIYQLSGSNVATLLVTLRQVAQDHLAELRLALEQMAADPGMFVGVDRATLLASAKRGEVVLIDVRPQTEYETAHLPHARSMPVAEIERRLAELPRDRQIIAYCRGPFCVLSNEAVSVLSAKGYRVHKILDGVSEWQAAGLPIEQPVARVEKP